MPASLNEITPFRYVIVHAKSVRQPARN